MQELVFRHTFFIAGMALIRGWLLLEGDYFCKSNMSKGKSERVNKPTWLFKIVPRGVSLQQTNYICLL